MCLVWRQRRPLYLLGVVCLAIATLTFALGHVAPFWVKQNQELDLNVPALNIGIWFMCPIGNQGNCFKYNYSVDEDYLKATRILQVLGLLGLLLSLIVAVCANCRHTLPPFSLVIEIITCVSALLGFSGAMVFLGYTRERVASRPYLDYNWAFALNIAACILALVAALVILTANIRRHRAAAKHSSGGSESSMRWQNVVYASSDESTSPGRLSEHVPADISSRRQQINHYGYPSPYLDSPQSYCDSDEPHFLPQSDPIGVPNISVSPKPLVHNGTEAGRYQAGGMDRNDAGWLKGMDARSRYDEREYHILRVDPHLWAPDHTVVEAVRVASPLQVMQPRVFMLPRVVVRGYYEPGLGYPEYRML